MIINKDYKYNLFKHDCDSFNFWAALSSIYLNNNKVSNLFAIKNQKRVEDDVLFIRNSPS